MKILQYGMFCILKNEQICLKLCHHKYKVKNVTRMVHNFKSNFKISFKYKSYKSYSYSVIDESIGNFWIYYS